MCLTSCTDINSFSLRSELASIHFSAPNLFQAICADRSPLSFPKFFPLLPPPFSVRVRSAADKVEMGMGRWNEGPSKSLLLGNQPFGHHKGGNRDWQFAFPADRSSLLIDYLIIDFPRSQCAAALARAPPDWPSPPPRLPTEIWVSSFSRRPQGEFSERFQLEGGEKKILLRAERTAIPARGCEVSSSLVELPRLSHRSRSEPGGQKNKNENNTLNIIKGKLTVGE